MCSEMMNNRTKALFYDIDGTLLSEKTGRVPESAVQALKEARAKAYEATEWVDFANKYMRHDIGRAIDEVK